VERVVKIVKERLPFWEKTSFFEIPLWNLGNPLYAENLYLRNLGNPLYAEPLFTEPGKSSLCGEPLFTEPGKSSLCGTWKLFYLRNTFGTLSIKRGKSVNLEKKSSLWEGTCEI